MNHVRDNGSNYVQWLQSPAQYKALSRRISRNKRRKLWKNETEFWKPQRMNQMLPVVQDLRRDESTNVVEWTQLVPAANKRIEEVKNEIQKSLDQGTVKPFIAIWRVKRLSTTTTVQRKIMQEFGIHDEPFVAKVAINSIDTARKLLTIKHLIALEYLNSASNEDPIESYPALSYDRDEKFAIDCRLKPELKLEQGPDIELIEKDEKNAEFCETWQLTERAILKRLRVLKDKSFLFKEYYPTHYSFPGRILKSLPTRIGEVNRYKMF